MLKILHVSITEIFVAWCPAWCQWESLRESLRGPVLYVCLRFEHCSFKLAVRCQCPDFIKSLSVHLFAVHPFLSVTRRTEWHSSWIESWTASVGTFTKRLWLLWPSRFAAISVFCVSAAICDVCAPEMCMLVTNVNYKFGDRSFSAAGPRLWNDLPPGLRRPGLTFDSFRQSLKSHLFGDRST